MFLPPAYPTDDICQTQRCSDNTQRGAIINRKHTNAAQTYTGRYNHAWNTSTDGVQQRNTNTHILLEAAMNFGDIVMVIMGLQQQTIVVNVHVK